MPPLGSRPALDGVRALAIIPVLLFHSAFARTFQGGRIGVDLFFVLSGFLITNLLLEEQERTGEIDVRRFYVRRALRLGPAMLCVLAFAWGATLGPGGLGATPSMMARFTLFVLTYTNNWASALASASVPAPLGHFWSLAVEEQFYLLWPWLLIVAFRSRLPRRTMLVALLATVAALSLWRTLLWRIDHDPFRAVFGTDTRAGGLLFGAAIAVARHMGLRISTSLARALVAIGLACYTLLIPMPYDLEGRLILAGLQPVELAAGMIIVGLTGAAVVPFARLLEWRPALWLGRRSYAIYLWHLPLGIFARQLIPNGALASSVLGVLCTLVAAELSFRYLERPILQLRATLPEPQPRPVLAAAA